MLEKVRDTQKKGVINSAKRNRKISGNNLATRDRITRG